MIKNLMDLDLYKITVQQMILHRFANVTAEYAFTCRNASQVKLTTYVKLGELKDALYNLDSLNLGDIYNYLSNQDFITPEYLEFLDNYKLNPKRFLTIKENGDTFDIRAKGPWLYIILFETLVLSTVNELYSKNFLLHHGIDTESALVLGRNNLNKKIELLKAYNSTSPQPLPLIEFGTRRRFSSEWQEEVITTLKREIPESLIGTSNVYFAAKHNLKAIGTFGHEYVMGMQGLFPIQHAQREAFKIWLREYRGKWGIALTDTYDDSKFLKDFSFEMAKGYDGVRHDSGDPYEYGNMIINMYKGYGIDPMSKRIVFSDGLDIPHCIALHQAFHDKINVSFGVGTNLTNDMNLFKVPQIVMKIVSSHGQPTIKLSNNPAKISCECEEMIPYVTKMVKLFS